MKTHNPPLSNLQVELLKLFSNDIPEKDLLEIKKLIVNYFAEKLTKQADVIWDSKGLNEEDILNTHFRTPYKKEQE